MAYPRWTADAHGAAALRAERAEDFELARAHLALGMRARPAHAEYHFDAARVWRRDGDPRAAAIHLEEAARLGHDPAAIRFAELLLATSRAGWRSTEADLSLMLRNGYPAAAEIHEVLARAYFNDYMFHRAYEECEAWSAADPGSAAAWELKGEIENRLGHPAGAIECYREALARNPNMYRSLVGSAAVLARRQDYAAARAQFVKARDLRPSAREPRVGLAQVLMEEFRLDEARQELQLLFDFAPDDREVTGLAGRVELLAGRLEEAERLLRHSADRASDRAVLHALQQCLVRRGNVAEAKSVAERLELLHGDLNRMEILAQIMMQHSDPAARFEAGQIMIRHGFVREGVAWFQQALRCDPAYQPALQALSASPAVPPVRAADSRR